MARPLPLLLALVLPLSACGGGGSSASGDVTRTPTPGGWEEVVYRTLPEGSEGALPVALELGSLDGADGGFFFGDVRGIALTPGGDELLVLDYQASEVHAFDLEGRHLGLRHASGEGPGEVAEANGLFFDHTGALWINDHGRMRLTRVLPDGEVETHPFPLARYGYVWDGVVGADGRIWETLTVATDPTGTRPEPGYREVQRELWALGVDPVTEARDSIRIGIRTGRGIALERGYASVPHAPSGLHALDPAGVLWTMESSDRYRLTRIDLAAGDTLVQVELPFRGPLLTGEERSEAIQGVEDFMERAGRVAVDWDAVLPERKPAAYQLAVDGTGNAWVLRQQEEGGRWAADVVAPDGSYRRTWVLPFEPSRYYVPVIEDGWFFTLRSGEFDEQYVVGARIPEGG